MIKTVSIKCPDCCASLEIASGQKSALCSYCGAKIMLNNENEYIVRHVDEARLRELEISEQHRREAVKARLQREKKALRAREEGLRRLSKKKKIIWCVSAALVLAGIVGSLADVYFLSLSLVGIMVLALGLLSLSERGSRRKGLKKITPAMLADLERKNARKLKAELESAGFTCVEMVSLRDVTTGILTKAGSVDSVIINGNEARPGFYRADTVIKVVYHGFVLGK